MEFKRPKSHKGRQSQPTSSQHSNSRPHSPSTPQLNEKQSQPIMSARSLKSKQSPKKPAPSPLKKYLLSKKAVAIIAVIMVVAIGYILIAKPAQQTTKPGKTEANVSIDDKSTTVNTPAAPTYETVTPKGKSIDDLGGWQRVSPANSNPVFAYSDKIGDVSISVSQQPLPESFKKNTDSHVADLAKKFSATTKLDAGTIKAYIGTSAKGPQSVIFSQKETLVLIKSQKNIDTKAWVRYISSLQ